jgi:predicted alpha/beta-hydrolase family hydrolase
MTAHEEPGIPPFLFDGPAAAPTLLLTHGAGAPMDSPPLQAIAAGLAAAGVRVARFELPYMHLRRTTGARKPPDREPVLRRAWLEAIAALGGGPAVFIGGKSLGGRIASLIADEAGARGVVCLGYPFLPPGSSRPPRTAHLADLRTPALIVQGTRDPFGGPAEVAGYALASGIQVHWIEDGDHSFAPRRSSGRTTAQNLAEAAAVAAAWIRRGEPPPGTRAAG